MLVQKSVLNFCTSQASNLAFRTKPSQKGNIKNKLAPEGQNIGSQG